MLSSQAFSVGRSLELNTVISLLRERVWTCPDRHAFTMLVNGETVGDRWTYADLERRARAIAAHLQSRYAVGERALLLYPQGLEFIAAFFGCLYAGLIAVPIYPPRPNQRLDRIQAIATSAQATVALTTGPVLKTLQAAAWGDTLNCIATDTLDAGESEQWRAPFVTENTLAFLQYTSGSTGTPKGVKVSHGNLLNNLQAIQQQFGDTPHSVGVSWLPAYHDMGLIGGILQPIYVAASMVLMSPLDFLQKPLRWLQAISTYQATTSGGPNFAYDLCARKVKPEQLESLDLSHWELAFTGAEPVQWSTLERFATVFQPCGFRQEAFFPCYGLAESTLLVSGGRRLSGPVSHPIDEQALQQHQVVVPTRSGDRVLTGCGQPSRSQTVLIVNPETCHPCASDQVGEIWIAGPSVAQGYWNQPEQTQQTFGARLASDHQAGPFLRTGDLGFLLDGELFITGRLKDVIIVRGQNHYPQDIEATVEQSHSSLQRGGCAAFSVEVEGAEQLVVVQEIDRKHLKQLDAETVIQDIRSRIVQHHALQAHAVILIKPGYLPKTSSGKVQRHRCRNEFLTGGLQNIFN